LRTPAKNTLFLSWFVLAPAMATAVFEYSRRIFPPGMFKPLASSLLETPPHLDQKLTSQEIIGIPDHEEFSDG
jgi:hypothetical protein